MNINYIKQHCTDLSHDDTIRKKYYRKRFNSEQEQEPEVAADRYRQQNVCHADCVIHILPFLVRILNYNFGHKGSLSHPRTG